MRRISKIITTVALLVALSFPAYAGEYVLYWQPVCRHKAIYWASMIGEQYPVRIMYGYFLVKDGRKYYHVQPQVKIGKNWYYFEVKDNKVVSIILDMDTYFTDPKTSQSTMWVASYHFNSLTEYMIWFEEILVKETIE